MKANNYAIKIILPITVFSLLFAILGDKCLYWDALVINILIGVFSSSLVTLIIPAINYCLEKEKTLEKFLICGRKIITNYGMFPVTSATDEAASIILKMNDFDYTEFDNAFAEMSFINSRTLHLKVYDELYAPIVEMRSIIKKAAKIIKQCDNIEIKADAVQSVDAALNRHTTIEKNGLSVPSHERALVYVLKERFEGFFYDCIYPASMRKKTDRKGTSD